MNGSFTISKADTIKILTKYMESQYPGNPCQVKPRVERTYRGYPETESNELNLTLVFQKDLGLGIGPTALEVNLGEKEIKGLLNNALTTAGYETTGLNFNIEKTYSGPYESETTEFKGTTVHLKTLNKILPPPISNKV